MIKSKLNFFNFGDKNVILNLVFLFRKSWAFRSLMNTMASENAPSSSSTPASANCELPPSGDTAVIQITRELWAIGQYKQKTSGFIGPLQVGVEKVGQFF